MNRLKHNKQILTLYELAVVDVIKSHNPTQFATIRIYLTTLILLIINYYIIFSCGFL